MYFERNMFKTKLGVIFGFICLVFLQGVVQTRQVSSRIVNGKNASPGEFPFQVSLQKSEKHVCGGSIINKNYVITAAHCVNGYEKSPQFIKVVAGTWNLTKPQSIHDVKKIISHDFSPETGLNDIALLKVTKPFIFGKSIKAVKLPKPHQNLYIDQNVIVSGWGYTRTHSYKPPDILQKVELTIIDPASCKKAYEQNVHQVAENHFCVQAKDKGVCSADSGGPVTVKGVLYGVVSWGSKRGCAVTGQPDVFTNVSKYINWIEDYAFY